MDLGNKDWQVVEVTPDGWKVVDDASVKFRRSAEMLPIPTPTRGGDLEVLRRYINVNDGDDWVHLVSPLVAALRPSGPYPLLVLNGEQGSAKSTTARICKSLIVPNTAPLRPEPRKDHDLIIGAINGWTE